MTSSLCQFAIYIAALVADVALLTDILGVATVCVVAIVAGLGALALLEGV